MKIGILTWYSACNYGARAHSYALRKTVESLGHECIMVAFRPTNEKRVNFRSNVGKIYYSSSSSHDKGILKVSEF